MSLERYIDDLVCRDDGGGGLYAMQDRQYKTIALTDTSGTVQERYSYTPYGETFFYDSTFTLRTASSFNWVYLYTGRRLDPETGLYYFRNRYFDPRLGRFCSKDPIGYFGGDVNLYRYVRNGPASNTDPSGLADVGTGIGGAIGGTVGGIIGGVIGGTGGGLGGAAGGTVVAPGVGTIGGGVAGGVGGATVGAGMVLPSVFRLE